MELSKINFQGHPFHLVSPSPWPIITSLALLGLTINSVAYFHSVEESFYGVILGLICTIIGISIWFRDVSAEGTLGGDHTIAVQKGLNQGIILFIISEVFFFVSIFWAFFHSALSPVVEFGSQWPPIGIEPINAFEIPLLNTVILLSSGASLTWAHHALIQGNRQNAILGFIITLTLAAVFTGYQGIEYKDATFTIADGVYGSTFFFATGFHGIHVIIGSIFLAVGLARIINYSLTDIHHVGFESAALYWHFVDVVWLFLWVSIYWWAS